MLFPLFLYILTVQLLLKSLMLRRLPSVPEGIEDSMDVGESSIHLHPCASGSPDDLQGTVQHVQLLLAAYIQAASTPKTCTLQWALPDRLTTVLTVAILPLAGSTVSNIAPLPLDSYVVVPCVGFS